MKRVLDLLVIFLFSVSACWAENYPDMVTLESSENQSATFLSLGEAQKKDDIEVAIASYVDEMPAELFDLLAQGRSDFLTNHRRFGDDIKEAVARLEEICFGENRN